MRRTLRDDRGQAFPLYAVFIVLLLFAALAYFTVGKAAIVRSDAQGAADAAALAAAREARDTLLPGLDLAALPPDVWERILKGDAFDGSGACGAASSFAGRNGATATCSQAGLRFTARVTTNATVGNSVVPGVSGRHGMAGATAEIVPRCHLKSPGGTGGGAPTAEPPGPVGFTCDRGADVVFDPARPLPWGFLGRALFDIRLID
ncbi:pilus assembly protein TadG-related protein [Streptomyces sp. NPDC059564]|uniref:pilus assembly protein TadG-related protein n=1 Tax=Streptomyces sp. NPDC059564 TaxID=3346865 RepID=UPI0036AED788